MGRGCNDTSGPFNVRGCDLTAEWLPATEHVWVQFPATAPISQTSRAPARAAESPKLSLPGAAPGRLANFRWGRGRQAMHLPCKQADVGALPTDSTISLRETRPMHREKPHKLLQVGVTPTPATTACAVPPREVIRLPDCKSGVVKRSWK